MAKQIAILTYGSRGDVEPFVALGVGLQQAGYGVRLAAPEPFGPFVESQGLQYVPLAGDPDRLVRNLVEQAGGRWWRMVGVMSRYVLPLAARVLEASRAACEGVDGVVHSFLLTNTGYELARERGVPDLSAQLFPVFVATSDFPGVAFPDLPLGAFYRRLTHALTTQVFWQGSRVLYRWARRRHPEWPPLSGWPFQARDGRRTPLLFGFSPQVVPPSADWGQDVHVTGYWFLESGADWQPPEGLEAFLAAGPPPVYVGFGSAVTGDAGQFTQVVLDALARTGQRGVLGVGWDALPAGALPEHVYVAGSMPHEWLFPRMAAVVHHGGAGTTGAGLRAGVPNVIVPFTTDQPFWGRRVFQLGTGPRSIPRRALSADRLADAISTAVTDERMRAHARALGEALRREEGIARAIDVIERTVREGR
jgi:sterol 3beta-glucosyltransferase